MKAVVAWMLCALPVVAAGSPDTHPHRAPTLAVTRAEVRPSAERQFETWAFATIANAGAADALVEVRSPDCASAVLRATTLTDAGRSARTVASIPVPAGGTLALSPDTYFIAFIQPHAALRPGQTLRATLRFVSGARLDVDFAVVEAGGDPGDRGN